MAAIPIRFVDIDMYISTNKCTVWGMGLVKTD
jgi:hypothetical protein